MLFQLMLLLTLVPIVELMLIFRVHDWLTLQYGSNLSFFITIGTIVVTGVLGANLARNQGLSVLAKIQEATKSGQIPTDQLVEGAMVLVGGGLLLTPGYLTDAFGFALLFPLTRIFFRKSLKTWISNKMKSGEFVVHSNVSGFSAYSNPTAPKQSQLYNDAIDVEAEDLSKDP